MGFYDSDGVKVELRESVTIKKTVSPGTVIMFWVYESDVLSITLMVKIYLEIIIC